MTDPLERFRKVPVEPKGTPATKEPEGYVAFGSKDKVERLRVRRINEAARSPAYSYLLDIVYDDVYGTHFMLVYTFLMVLVRGKNLQGVVMALELGTAEFIQQFDPERWRKPSDIHAPFIEFIEVLEIANGLSSPSDKSGKAAQKGRVPDHVL